MEALICETGMGSQVQLLGRVENVDMPGLYALSSIVVLPSLQESTSISAMEGMAAGKPIVATCVGGLPFLVHLNESGLLVSPRDSDGLALAIRQLLENPSLAEQFGAAGRRRIETEMGWRMIATRTRQIYNLALRRFEKTMKSEQN